MLYEVITDTTMQIVRDVANYIYDTYGRFPAFVDPMYMRLVFQAMHIDTEFYDKYYPKGSYSDMHSRITSYNVCYTKLLRYTQGCLGNICNFIRVWYEYTLCFLCRFHNNHPIRGLTARAYYLYMVSVADQQNRIRNNFV